MQVCLMARLMLQRPAGAMRLARLWALPLLLLPLGALIGQVQATVWRSQQWRHTLQPNAHVRQLAQAVDAGSGQSNPSNGAGASPGGLVLSPPARPTVNISVPGAGSSSGSSSGSTGGSSGTAPTLAVNLSLSFTVPPSAIPITLGRVPAPPALNTSANVDAGGDQLLPQLQSLNGQLLPNSNGGTVQLEIVWTVQFQARVPIQPPPTPILFVPESPIIAATVCEESDLRSLIDLFSTALSDAAYGPSDGGGNATDGGGNGSSNVTDGGGAGVISSPGDASVSPGDAGSASNNTDGGDSTSVSSSGSGGSDGAMSSWAAASQSTAACVLDGEPPGSSTAGNNSNSSSNNSGNSSSNSSDSSNSSNSGNGSAQGSSPLADRATGTVTGSGSAPPSTDTRAQASTSPTLLPVPSASPTTSRDATGGRRQQRRLAQGGGFGFGGGILQPRPLLPPSSPSPPTAPPRPPAPPAPPPQPPYIPWFPPAPPSPPDSGACDGTPRRLRLSVQAPGDADLSALVTAGVQALRDFRAGPRETDVCELDTEKDIVITAQVQARFLLAVAPSATAGSGPSLCSSVASQAPGALQGVLGVPLTLDRQEACVLATGSSGSGGNANGGATMVPAPGADPSPRQETQPVNAPASPSGSPTNVVGVVVGTVVAVMAVGLMVGLGYAYKRRRVDGGGAVAGGVQVEDGKGPDGGGVVAPDDVVFNADGGGGDGGGHWQQQQHSAAHVGGSGGSGSGSAAVSGTGRGGGVGATVAVAGSGLAPRALYPPPIASPPWAGGVGGGSAPAAAGHAPMQAVGMGMYGTGPAASLGATSMPGAGLHSSGGQIPQSWGAHPTAGAAPATAAVAAPAPAAAAHDPAARDAEARRLNQKFKEMQMAQFMASIATPSEAAPSGTGAAGGSGGGGGRGKAGGKGGAAAAGAQGAQGPAGVQKKKLTKKQAKAAAAAAAAASEEPLMQGTVPAADGAPAGQNSLVSYIISLIKQSGGKNAEATAAAAAAAAAAVTSSQAAVQAPAALAVAGPGVGGAGTTRNASAPAPAAVAAATPATAAAAVAGSRGLAAAPAASPRGPPTTAAAAVAAPAAAAAATKLPVSQQPAPVAARRPFRAGEDLGAAAAAAAAAALSVLTGRPAAPKAGAAQVAGNDAPALRLPQGSAGQVASVQLSALLGAAAAGAPGAGLVRGNSTNPSAMGRAAAVHAPAVPAPAASGTGTALEARGTARISNELGGAHSSSLSALMGAPAANAAARSGSAAAGQALPFAAATRAEDRALLSSGAALRCARAVTTDGPSEQAEANPNFIKVRTPAGRVAQIQIAPLQGTAASGVAGVAGAAAPGVARSGSFPAPLLTHRSGSAHPASLNAAGLGTTGFSVGMGGMGAPMGGFGTAPLGSSSPPLPSQQRLASAPLSERLGAQVNLAGLGAALTPALGAPGAAPTALASSREPGGMHGGGSASSKLCLDLGGPGGGPEPRLTSGADEAAGLGRPSSARAATGVERAAGLGRSLGASRARTASDFEGSAGLSGPPGLAGSLTSGRGVSAAGGLAPSEGSGPPLGRFHTYVGTGGMGAPSSQPLDPTSLNHALSDPSHQYHGRPSGTTRAGAGAWTVSGASLGAAEAGGAGFAPVGSAGGAWGGGRGAGSGLLHPQHVAQEDVALELSGQMGPGQRLGQGQGQGRGLAQESVDVYGDAVGPGVWVGQRDRPGKQGGGAWGTGAGQGVTSMLDEAAACAAAAAAAGNTTRLGNGGSGGGGSGGASRSDLSGDRSAPASGGAGSSLGHSRNSHRSLPSPLDAFTAHHVAAIARAPMPEDRVHAAGAGAGMPVGAGVYPGAGAYPGAGIFPPGAAGIYHQEPGIYPGARGHQGVGGYQGSGAQQLASSEQSGGSNSWGAAAVRPAPLGAPRPVHLSEHSTASDQAGQGSTARRDSGEVAGGSGTGPLGGVVLVSGSAGGPDGNGSHGDGDAGGDIVDGGGAGCGGSPHSSEGHTSRAAAHHALLAGDGHWGAFGRPQQLATPLSSRAGGPEAPQTRHHWQQQQQQQQQQPVQHLGGLPLQHQHRPQDWQHGLDVAAMFAGSQDLYMDAAVFNADNPEPDLFQLLSDLASPPSSPSHAQGSVESPALAAAGMGTGGSAGSASPEVTLPVMPMGGSEALMQGQAGIQQGAQGGPPGAGPKVWGPEHQRQAAKAAAYSMSRLLMRQQAQQQQQQQQQQGSWVGQPPYAAVQLGTGGNVRDVVGERDGWQGEVRGQAADDLVQLFEEWAAGCSQVPAQVEAQV